MPAILSKTDVLDGRAQVFNYKRDPSSWYYREVIPGEKTYRTKKIPDAETQSQAVDGALDIFTQIRSAAVKPKKTKEKTTESLPPHRSIDLANVEVDTGGAHTIASSDRDTSAYKNRRKKGADVNKTIDDYLTQQSERVEALIIKEGTFKEICQTLSVHLKTYFETQGITRTSDIKPDSFKSYVTFRKWCTKLTRNKEAVIIKAFFDNYLIPNRLVSHEVVTTKKLIPKVKIKQSDLDANPAINKEDWEKINKWIRFSYLKAGKAHPRPSVYYWRYLFWHFTLIMKNTGARPNELLNLRWKDVEIEDVGRVSQSKLREEIEELEQEGIDVVGEYNRKKGEWVPSSEELGRVERLVAHIYIRTTKTGDQREVPTNLGNAFRRFKKFQDEYIAAHDLPVSITPNTLIFGNPNNDYFPYQYACFSNSWWKMMAELKPLLKGHKFSERPYTIYSMRSTFIENMLLSKMDIFLLSRICGHSVDMLTRHYERIDVKERAEEITKINYGARDRDKIVVNLFEDE